MSDNYFNQKVFNSDGSLKLLSDDIREIIKEYLKDNLKIKLSSEEFMGMVEIEAIVTLEGEILTRDKICQ